MTTDNDRDTAIRTIRDALRRRSGKPWSVTGGRGTAWGWIRIDAPPARRTMRSRLKAGVITTWPDDYEEYDSGKSGGYMTTTDRAELAALLGLETAHQRDVNIPSSSAYYREYIDRAEGRTPSVTGTPYWD